MTTKATVATTIAALFLVTGCSSAPQQQASPGTEDPPTASTSPSSTPTSPAEGAAAATPSGRQTSASTSTATPTAAATQPAPLGKVSSYQEGYPYRIGGLPERWRSDIGWYAKKDQGAEVLGSLAAFVERDPQTQEQILVVANRAGDVLYRSPSLGLQQPQAVEPFLARVRQNGQEFVTFYQIGVPAEAASKEMAGVPVAQLIVVDETGKARVIEEDVTHYRPRPTQDGVRALALTATDGSLAQQSGVAGGQGLGYARVLNAETGELEPVPQLDGQSWLGRIDGVDVYRSPGSMDAGTGKPVATVGTPDWSTTFYDHPSGSITFGPNYLSVITLDGTCEIRDLGTGELLSFEGAANGCAYESAAIPTFGSASSPDGELFLMHWRDEQDVDSQWVVNLRTGEQHQIDPATDFRPVMVSSAGEVYGRNTAGDATGYLRFPDQMQPQFHDTRLDLPSAITDDGLAVFMYEDQATYFAVPTE